MTTGARGAAAPGLRRGFRATAAALALAGCLGVGLISPVHADDTHAHSTDAASAPPGPAATTDDGPLSGLTGKQQRTLDRISSAASSASSTAASVQVALEEASLASAAAAAVQESAAAAQQAATAGELRSQLAQLDAARMQAVVDGWVRQLASEADTTTTQVWAILVDPTADPSAELAVVQSGLRVSGQLVDAIGDLEDAQVVALTAQQAAERAAIAAAEEAKAAEKSARVAARVLESARSEYLSAQDQLVSLVDAAVLADPKQGPAGDMAGKVADVVNGVRAAGSSSGAGCGVPVAGVAYSNGMLTPDVLCGMASAPGHKLRTDAAAAFDRLSDAYQRRFSTPLCITDSYRTLAAQIDVKRRKPFLAATPGTSNHGWGLAVDACGGVDSPTSEEHRWMMANAVLFGWVLPTWAQADGSKPEPWHWEFSADLAAQMAQVLDQMRATGAIGPKKAAGAAGRAADDAAAPVKGAVGSLVGSAAR